VDRRVLVLPLANAMQTLHAKKRLAKDGQPIVYSVSVILLFYRNNINVIIALHENSGCGADCTCEDDNCKCDFKAGDEDDNNDDDDNKE
jgi:hypothetical protein